MEFLEAATWITSSKIILIDILLAGDNAVVFGMAMNTLLATVYIPNFYELMQKLQEKFSKKKGNNDKQEGSM